MKSHQEWHNKSIVVNPRWKMKCSTRVKGMAHGAIDTVCSCESHATSSMDLEHTALNTQNDVKKDLKIFKAVGAEAVVKEMQQQLHDQALLKPKHANLLTRAWTEKKHSLHGSTDECKQCVYKTKEKTRALTVSVESLLFPSCVINHAKEHQKSSMMTHDIP